MKEKYINPFTDFGFKKLFGTEANKALLMDFLNELLADKGKITSLTFIKTEQLGATEPDRKAIFDLYCLNEKGERFIVELQKARQQFFKDRSVYYATFPIQEQAQKGDWNYKLEAVYTVSIMDFEFDDTSPNHLRHDVQLVETQTQRVFYDKLRFIYLEMPKFNKSIDQLETHYDKWLYVLKNLPKLDRIPDKLQEQIFVQLFEIAEIARFDERELRAYNESVKVYRDWKNVLDTAITEKVIEIVGLAIKNGATNEFIADITGVSVEEIEKLRTQKPDTYEP